MAMAGLRAEAARFGADGVVGVRLDFSGAEGKGRDFRFVATGTAIRSTTGAARHLRRTARPAPAHRRNTVPAVQAVPGDPRADRHVRPGTSRPGPSSPAI